jgi:hypothetical protein
MNDNPFSTSNHGMVSFIVKSPFAYSDMYRTALNASTQIACSDTAATSDTTGLA